MQLYRTELDLKKARVAFRTSALPFDNWSIRIRTAFNMAFYPRISRDAADWTGRGRQFIMPDWLTTIPNRWPEDVRHFFYPGPSNLLTPPDDALFKVDYKARLGVVQPDSRMLIPVEPTVRKSRLVLERHAACHNDRVVEIVREIEALERERLYQRKQRAYRRRRRTTREIQWDGGFQFALELGVSFGPDKPVAVVVVDEAHDAVEAVEPAGPLLAGITLVPPPPVPCESCLRPGNSKAGRRRRRRTC